MMLSLAHHAVISSARRGVGGIAGGSGVRNTSAVSSALDNSPLFPVRWKSSSSKGKDKDGGGFRPRRPASKGYVVPKQQRVRRESKKKANHLIDRNFTHFDDFNDGGQAELEESVRQAKRDRARGRTPDSEYQLKMMDYLTSREGSTEQKMLQRRILAESFDTPEEGAAFLAELKKDVNEAFENTLGFGEDDPPKDADNFRDDDGDGSVDLHSVIPPRHDWSETVIRMDRVQKVQKGGTMLRYRTLVIGGNARGVAGFGIGKAAEPKEATEAASRMCRRNVFFVDPYRTSGLTTDLVGKHNSCIVRLRAMPGYRGLRGHPLVRDILLYFGITDVSAKSHGNRNIYNVVYATFKAIMKHRSLEDISRARGKRYLTLDKAKRLDLNSDLRSVVMNGKR